MRQPKKAWLNGLPITGRDEEGTVWRTLGLEEWDSMSASTGTVTQHPFGDGGYIDPAYREALSLRCVLRLEAATAESAVAALAQLKRVTPYRDVAPLVVDRLGVIEHRLVRVEDKPSFKIVRDRFVHADIQLIAPDPRKLGGDGGAPYQFQAEAFLPSTTGGLQIPGEVVERTNLCTNPGAETLDGYSTANGATNELVTNSGVAGVGAGLTSIKATLSNFAGDTGERIHSGVVPEGEKRTFSVWVKTALIGVRINVQGTGIVAIASSASHTGDGMWQRLTATATGAATGSYIAYILKTGSTAGQFFQFTGLLVEDAPASGTYFDGSTPAAPPLTYSWTGAASASTSIATRAAGITVPFSIGATVVSGSVTVTATGDAPPPVLVRVNGPAVQPIIRDEAGGVMPFDISLSAGQWLDVDLDARTVKLNGTVNRRNLLRGQWITPRSGMVLSLDAAVYDPLTSMTVYWTDASY